MKAAKIVMVIHRDPEMRLILRSALQAHGPKVMTGESWLDLISNDSGPSPAVILLDRTLLTPEKKDVLTSLQQKWIDSEIVLLPEALENVDTRHDSLIQLLHHLDRLLAMTSTRVLLAVAEETN